MIWVDYVIVGIIALSALIGFVRGLVREVISLAIWVGALLVAWLYFRDLEVHLTPWISTSSLRLGAAFLILVLVVLILGTIVGHLFTLVVDMAGLTGTDRMLGLVFGGARGGLLVAMVVFLAALTPLPEDPWWGDSLLIGRFQTLADVVLSEVPPDLVDQVKRL